MASQHTVTITGLGHLGDGIAMHNGHTLHVSHGLPGEVVTIQPHPSAPERKNKQIPKGKRRSPRSTPQNSKWMITALQTPSPHRIDPGCPHFRGQGCGGCAVRHMEDHFYLNWKTETLRQTLAPLEMVQNISLTNVLHPVHRIPEGLRRRATFKFPRRKGKVYPGFHAAARHKIIALTQCKQLLPALWQTAKSLADLLTAQQCETTGVEATLTETNTGIDAALSWPTPLSFALRDALIIWARDQDIARLTITHDGFNDPLATLRTPEIHFGSGKITPPPHIFLQPSAAGEQAIAARLHDFFNTQTRILDLFCGAGSFTLPLAERAPVHGVDNAPLAMAALQEGAKSFGSGRVTTTIRDLFRTPLRTDELLPYSGIVIDPPRAGAKDQIEKIAALPKARQHTTTQADRSPLLQSKNSIPSAGIKLAYISCNPATFTRDAKVLLAAGWQLHAIHPIDQFPKSAHLELVALFSCP